ncbi:ApeP family dehydratase [Chitinimonas lacunae]|uniref:Thioester dehydrase n=1 Tax=Chitinimonas lacunae TaxID=1963018 RepID=A0ABV8MSZ3_9NEIS
MEQRIDEAIDRIVPHGGAMSLLDRPLAGGDDWLRAEVTIRPDSLFFDGRGVGGWVGVEYMAQAVAAWAGWRARLRGEAPRIGFLLGTRRYECSRPCFVAGEVLNVTVRREFQADNGLGQFDCRIEIDGVTVANAALTVFEPQDAETFLKGSGNE